MEEMAAKMSAKKLQRMRKVNFVLNTFRRCSGMRRRGRADIRSDKAAPPRSTDDHSLGYDCEIYLVCCTCIDTELLHAQRPYSSEIGPCLACGVRLFYWATSFAIRAASPEYPGMAGSLTLY